MPKFTRARDFGRTTRLGRDQEEDLLDEMFNDPTTSAGELIAALIEHCPDDKAEELHSALRELSEDRNPRRWARDKLELRRHARDRRGGDSGRRMGRDLSEAELTTPGRSGSVEEFDRSRDKDSTALDRRAPRTAHDMAFDAQARRNPALASFRHRFPNAARVQRF